MSQFTADYFLSNNLTYLTRVFMFFWGHHGSRGWYDNPQPALRPVFIAAQCAILCVQNVYAWVVRGYCRSNSACFVSESFVLYIYSPQPRLQVPLSTRPLCPMPDRHQATQPTRHASTVIAGWCYGDPMRFTLHTA